VTIDTEATINDPAGAQNLDHYRRPFLAVERIVRGGPPARLEIVQGERSLVLSIEGGDIDAAYEALDDLRQPDSECWRAVRENRDPGLVALVDQLDRLSWLGEADHSGHAQISREPDEFRHLAQRGIDWLVEVAIPDDWIAGETSLVAVMRRFAAESTGHPPEAPRLSSLRTEEIDIAGEALSLMLRRWRHTAPMALLVVHTIFRSAVDHLSGAGMTVVWNHADHDPTLADAHEVGKRVSAALALAVLSAARCYRSNFSDFVPTADLAGPGLNILIAAEAAAEKLMLERGPSTLMRVLDHGVAVHRAAVGVYLHQYFITIRYIDSVYAFLGQDLRPELRMAGTHYLQEEIGHEVHELEACRDLGVPDHAIAQFAPLPFFAAYPDVLGAIAEIDPLAFLLSISVAEGLPGAGKPLAAALASKGIVGASLTAHQGIDERLDHALMTRRLMRHVPWVEPSQAQRAISRFLFVVELSQLGWRQLANYAEATARPEVPVSFGLSARDLLMTFR
jgi:hypothetical protein